MDDATAEARREARKARRHARQRALLLAAARRVLADRGLQEFTIARVAKAADVSKPSVYYYFRSREDLVGALADPLAADEAACLTRAAYAAEDGAGALRGALDAVVAWHLEDLDRYRLLYLWPTVVGTTTDFYGEVLAPRRAQALGVLAGRLGAHPAAAALAELVLVTAHGVVATAAGRESMGQDPHAHLPGLLTAAQDALASAAG